MSTSLKDKTVRGVGWSAADSFLGQGVTFLVGIVLARLLSPSEYGLSGIITIFTTILSGFVDCGFSNSLIRKKETSNDDYNTMFIVNLTMSIAMYAVLFASAPLIAEFFEREELTTLTYQKNRFQDQDKGFVYSSGFKRNHRYFDGIQRMRRVVIGGADDSKPSV